MTRPRITKLPDELTKLRVENASLRIELQATELVLQNLSRNIGIDLLDRANREVSAEMSFATASAIAKGLQPNSSKAERLAGLQQFNLFWSNLRRRG
jgi:hypothetical protein